MTQDTPFENAAESITVRIGKFTTRWYALLFFLLIFVGLGAYAFLQQTLHGLVVTGMRTIGVGGAAWGVYIMFDIYFVGVSFAGIIVAALIRLFNIKDLKPLARLAELVAILSLILALPCIMSDLGRPEKGLFYLPKFARPMSPFFGSFTLVAAGYLFASMVYLYLAGRADAALMASRPSPWRWFYILWASGFKNTREEWERHHKVSFWLALAVIPLLVTAHSTLGFIFGIQGGRPGWYSALQAPGFVIMAGVSGVGALLVITAFLRKLLHLENVIKPEAIRWLGNFLWILTLVYLYFMVVEELTANYASSEMERVVAHSIVFGAYAKFFWTVVSCFVIAFGIMFLQFARGKFSIGWAVTAGVLVNIAAIIKRFLIVVPSQTHGLFLPAPAAYYFPTWVEFALIFGLFALGGVMFLIFIKIFPLVPIITLEQALQTAPSVKESAGSLFMRRTLFFVTLMAGLILAVIGFVFSARIGTKPFLDPVIPWSPVIFIIGVMMTFYSAAVYEIVPQLLLKQSPDQSSIKRPT